MRERPIHSDGTEEVKEGPSRPASDADSEKDQQSGRPFNDSLSRELSNLFKTDSRTSEGGHK